eukprot:CAMPEP_0115582282 /NCGR_PEP_ID=MMETSP0272-20121206/5580_1 /TAXON_ID=71861 /ORGANISM="Scrippsiella trochoidea, Strain CCMP3099" /LENGTH=401 /DNA_ID=CAMNT_0003017265 /DNA_START=81 /DNA_END=1286 /DNA_ORIENTATION=+
MTQFDEDRLTRLIERLLSPDVQVQEPAMVQEVPARLSDGEVEKVFIDHVPGVRKFLFRGHPGQYSLKFMVSAYKHGLRAFSSTALHNHLLSCMRLIVHYGQEERPGAKALLAEVAEGFLDCQAVQARAIERVALRMQGLTLDFTGLVVQLVGEYKTLALKMLAAERLCQGLARDYDGTPTHYENRLTADVGPLLGANADDVRRAVLDEHARSRYACLDGAEAAKAAARCRELFDVDAMLQAFVAEVNSFDAETSSNTLPAMFLVWASERLSRKHVVLDAETCSRTEVDCAFAVCVFEDLFLSGPAAPAEETFRGVPISEIFRQPNAVTLAQDLDAAKPSDASGTSAPLLEGDQSMGITYSSRVAQWLLQVVDSLWIGIKAILQGRFQWRWCSVFLPSGNTD